MAVSHLIADRWTGIFRQWYDVSSGQAYKIGITKLKHRMCHCLNLRFNSCTYSMLVRASNAVTIWHVWLNRELNISFEWLNQQQNSDDNCRQYHTNHTTFGNSTAIFFLAFSSFSKLHPRFRNLSGLFAFLFKNNHITQINSSIDAITHHLWHFAIHMKWHGSVWRGQGELSNSKLCWTTVIWYILM